MIPRFNPAKFSCGLLKGMIYMNAEPLVISKKTFTNFEHTSSCAWMSGVADWL